MAAAKTEVSVIGSGSWATALVKMLSGNASGITWYIHEQEIIDHILVHKNNPRYLSMVNHNLDNINLTNDINHAFDSSETIILVVPSAFLKDSLEGLMVDISTKTVCSAIKGIVPEYNQIVGDFLHKNYSLPYDNLVVLTGPTHAEEIAMEKLTYLTIASKDSSKAVRISGLLENYYLRTVISNDITGTEYAAVIKNIYAIAAGIAQGLGYGDNFQAVLIANAVTEMRNFIRAIYSNDRDINSSAYLGDLLVTAYSKFSRNRTFGNMIGRGYSVHFTRMEMEMVAEGYYASDCINEINQSLRVNIPVADTVYRILYEKANPSGEFNELIKILK